jgi:chromosome segregation ATPase
LAIALNVALGPIGIALIAVGAAAIGTAAALTNVNKEVKELTELQKNFSGAIDEQLKKSGDEEAARRVKIKQNKETIEQLKQNIELGKELIGQINLTTGKILTENEFNKKKAEVLKEIAELEKENIELSKSKAQRTQRIKEAAEAAKIAAEEAAIAAEEEKKRKLEEAMLAEEMRLQELQKIEEHERRKQQIIQASFNAMKQLTSDFFAFGQSMRDHDLDAELKALELEKEEALKTSQDKEATEKEFNRRIAEAKTAAAEKDKKASIVQSIINTALAVTKTLATVPPPVSFVLAGITAALGAAQTALIAAKPIPQFAQGTNFAPGGAALVGERGPELVTLPQGSRVIPNNEVNNVSTNNNNVNINVQTNDPIEFVNTLRREYGVDVFGEA